MLSSFSVQMYKKIYISNSVGLKYWELSTLGIPQRSVILKEVKNLSESKTVDSHVDLEIFRFAQDDIVADCHVR